MDKRPNVGVGVIVIKDGKVLLGKRKKTHGSGSWCFPGGHLEFGESLEGCAKREVLEEAGIYIRNIRLGTFTNDIFQEEGKHYVTLFIVSDWDHGEPRVLEPDKCEEWGYFAWNDFPEPVFLPIKNLLQQNYNPFER